MMVPVAPAPGDSAAAALRFMISVTVTSGPPLTDVAFFGFATLTVLRTLYSPNSLIEFDTSLIVPSAPAPGLSGDVAFSCTVSVTATSGPPLLAVASFAIARRVVLVTSIFAASLMLPETSTIVPFAGVPGLGIES